MEKFKVIIISLIILLFNVNIFALEEMKKVFISQFVNHLALDMTTKGIVDGLEKMVINAGLI